MNRYNSTFRAKKSYTWKRSRKPMNRNGRRTKDWSKVRRRLKIEFAAAGITGCELRYDGCWGDNGLGFAHGRKRRHLTSEELKTLTILACNPCHGKIEYLAPAEMLRIVEETILKRVSKGK